MYQELLHFFSFILCAAGLGVAVIGILLAISPFTTSLIRHKFQAAFPFLVMTLCGLLGAFIGYLVLHCLGAFDGPEIKYKKLEIEVPESIRVDARFYQDSQEIHRESL